MAFESKSLTLPPHLPSSSSDRNDGHHRHHQKNGSSRPVSFYDNCTESNTSIMRNNRIHRNSVSEVETTLDKSPTQAFSLVTTVPQNITTQSIANKHTPTRNSLRHSRMIALNQNGRVPRKYLPAIIRYHKLAKALLGLVVLLGAALCFLALWLLIWTPNLRQRDNPHWSGIPVLLSGIVGLILLCCCKKEYPGMKRGYFVYAFKVLSVSLSVLGAATCFIACAFAIIHLVALYTMNCGPPDKLDATCICYEVPLSNSTQSIKSYHYVDLSCVEVDNVLTILVIFSCFTNFFAGILEVWYVYLHWASRYVYTYSEVKTNEDNNTVVLSTIR